MQIQKLTSMLSKNYEVFSQVTGRVDGKFGLTFERNKPYGGYGGGIEKGQEELVKNAVDLKIWQDQYKDVLLKYAKEQTKIQTEIAHPPLTTHPKSPTPS